MDTHCHARVLGRKWVKGWEIKLTSRGMFTREKYIYIRERSHSGAFVSLVQPGSSCALRKVAEYALQKWNEKGRKKLKARQIIGFGSAWTWVCAQQCGCVCTAGVCPGSSQQGAGFGTVGHSYSTSLLKNHWTPLSPCPALFRNKRVQNAYRKVLTKHHFRYGKTFLLFLSFPIPTLGHTDLALVPFWHHNDILKKKGFLSYVVTKLCKPLPLGTN